MKSQPVYSILGFVLAVCAWHGDAAALRARNTTEVSAVAQKVTGLLCREPGHNGTNDVDVVLEEGGRRSLLFSRNVTHKGELIGREVAGQQSTVHCAKEVAHPDDTQCLPADLSKPVPTCAEVGQSKRCPCSTMFNEPLKLAYQQAMVIEVGKLCEAKAKTTKEPLRVLMFGLGGGAVPMYIRHHCDSALIESVESDPRVALIAQRLFGFRADSQNKVEIADGEEAAARHAATHPWPAGPHYDVVLVDCFDGHATVPHSCRSDRFLHSVYAALGPDGTVLHNVMDTDVARVMPMYETTFGTSWTSKQPVQSGQFLIIAKTHSNHPRPAAQLRPTAA